MEILSIRSSQRSQWLDISSQVQQLVSRKGMNHGACLLFVPHTTAAVTINEGADPSVKSDVLGILEQIAPAGRSYSHTEGNSDAHVKSSLVGCSILVPIRDGKLTTGTWQTIFFCEFDGPRDRTIQVHFLDGPS